MRESIIQNAIRLELSKFPEFTHWRNNTGVGWAGTPVKINKPCQIFAEAGDVLVKNARPLHAGLCPGSSDLIGLKRVTITPDMVGQTIAQFVAVEVKTRRGKATDKQNNFLDVVNNAGGVGIVARSADDLEQIK